MSNSYYFIKASRESLAAGESVQLMILDFVRHLEEQLQQMPAPAGIELPPLFDLQPHNDNAVPKYTIKAYVDANIALPEARKQVAETFLFKLYDLVAEEGIVADVFLHGSILQGTAVTASDLDISLRFEDSQHNDLQQVCLLLQQNRKKLGLQHFVKVVGKSCPTIKCKLNNGLSIDVTDGSTRQQALCCGYFLKHVVCQRPDAAIYIRILKQWFMRTSWYGGCKQCPGGVAYSILVMRAMQHLELLPRFERFNFGDFGEMNEHFAPYWERHGVRASTEEDLTDEVLYKRFCSILEWLIETNLTEMISLSPLDAAENPTGGQMIIYSPPNDYGNVTALVTNQTRIIWILPELKKLLKEWKDDPMAVLQSIV